jgi:hypothetical protein
MDRNPAADARTLQRWVILGAVALAACLAGVLLLLVFRVIPPIVGQATDAVTGEAVPGVTVALQIEDFTAGFSVPVQVYRVSTTNRSGWFWLAGLLRWRGFPIPNFGDSWLTVNQVPGETGGRAASAETQVQYNPLSNRTGAAVDNPRYFPVVMTFDRDGCDRVWPATCLYRGLWWGISVPLIPVLDDVQRCTTIRDQSLRERCRQLNTYRAAFLRVDTFADAQRGRRLCAQVDGRQVSATCRRQLELYTAMPDAYGRPAPEPDAEPRLEGLFIPAIGRIVRARQACDPNANAAGHLHCRAVYEDDQMDRLVTVTFEEWADRSAPPDDALQTSPTYLDYSRATIVREAHANGLIRMYRGPQNIAADWVSGNRYLHLYFQRAIAAETAFIDRYLAKFPSTLH